MAGNDLPSVGRVKLTDLVAYEGLPSESYKLSVSTLSQSLAQYSAAIIQLPPADASILRSCLESSRLYFHQRPPYSSADMIHNDSREWCKTSGYNANPQLWQENYDFRPGLTPTELNTEIELAPAGMSDAFSVLGKASRDIVEAVGFYLNLRSSPFTEILDNVPLRNQEISSSVLSVCSHARPSFQAGPHHSLTTQEDGQLVIFAEHEHHQVDKCLITLVKSDKEGLQIRDFNGQWILVDGDLGPHEAIVYPGLALYQATAGYVSPALQRIDIGSLHGSMFGRCSVVFKLMPKSMASLNCSEMRAAGHGVEAQFQHPVSVDDFMQRSHSTVQLFHRHNFTNQSFPTPQDGSIKSLLRRKKQNARCKLLPPSKRLRLEAQRVLKERVQDIADKKGIKLRFCTLKECENHIHSIDSPCANTRMEIGWPPGVPFVHPHDLPNKAKLGFLEMYEPGWSAAHDMELSLIDSGQPSQHHPAS